MVMHPALATKHLAKTHNQFNVTHHWMRIKGMFFKYFLCLGVVVTLWTAKVVEDHNIFYNPWIIGQ
jgi:hypothetical protein